MLTTETGIETDKNERGRHAYIAPAGDGDGGGDMGKRHESEIGEEGVCVRVSCCSQCPDLS